MTSSLDETMIEIDHLVEQFVADSRALGVLLGDVRAGSRVRADGVPLSWRFSDPRAVIADGIVPFFIDWGDTPHPAKMAAIGAELITFRAEHPDHERVRKLLDAIGLQLALCAGPRPALIATIRTAAGQIEVR